MAIGIGRRKFIAALGAGALARPFAARAQQRDRLRNIALLMGLREDDPEGQLEITSLRQGLQQLGWIEGRNIQIAYRWAGPDVERAAIFAKELVGLNPELILSRSTPATAALRRETHTIPIVFTVVAEPIGSGFVNSLPRPGGNITGFTNLEPQIAGKWLALLKQVAPRLARAALIFNPNTAPYAEPFLLLAQADASTLGVQLIPTPVRSNAEVENAITGLKPENGDGVVGMTDSFIIDNRELITQLVTRHRLPAIYPYRFFAVQGDLMSYGVDLPDMFRRAASYVDQILKGASPTDLPVQAPTKYELVINLKTAKVLGLAVPPTLLATADEVIE
jgi:putative ABC transport system substrate-binding protein